MGKKEPRLNILFWGPFWFVVTQLIGLGLASKMLETPSPIKTLRPLFSIPWLPSEIFQPPWPFWVFLLIFFGSVFFVFCILNQLSSGKTSHTTSDESIRLVCRIYFTFCIGFFGLFLFEALYGMMPSGYFLPILLSISFAGILGLTWFLLFTVWIHNIALMLITVALGGVLGFSFTPWGIILILIIVSIYDVIAVYGIGKLKNPMFRLVENLMHYHFVPALIFPLKTSDFKASLKEVKLGDERFSILGGGDLFFPLFFAVSVLNFYGFFNALIVTGFALIGIFAVYITLIFLQPERKNVGLPALPFLSFFSILGFLISLII